MASANSTDYVVIALYAPAKIPPQGCWNIYGIGLPETILKKVYYENAARILRI